MLLESAKKFVERLTGLGRPLRRELAGLVRERQPAAYRFKDDGLVPNHPRWPLVRYRGAVRLPQELDPAAVLEDLFAANGWHRAWRDGIYDWLHYHSRIHEVLGVASGTAKVRFGGARGRTLQLKAGDVVILPAGTGHQCLSASEDFLVVGAYPKAGIYDECRPRPADHYRAVKTIGKVPRPRKDPVYGVRGPMTKFWRRS